MIAEIICPNCAKRMKYESRVNVLKGKYKQCVFCGNRINVQTYLQKIL